MDSTTPPPNGQGRILSIDFFRGFVMFVLVTGITGIFSEWVKSGNAGGLITLINTQFSHGVWYNLTFWDLIQSALPGS